MENKLFEELVLKNENGLYRLSMSILKNYADAQDAVHDAILIAFEKRDALKNPDAFGPWLFRILVRVCYKELRRKRRFADIGDTFPDVPSRDNPYADVEMGALLDSLPVKIRTTVLLHYVEGYSVKEVAQILRIPEGTVKSRLSTGRALLKEKLETTEPVAQACRG